MAISQAMKAFQIFSGLSAISITPLAHSFLKAKEEIKSLNLPDRQATDEHRKEKESSTSAMKRAVQIIESKKGNKEGEKKCFWLFGALRGFELFMCFNTTKLSSLTLFHYKWREQELNEINEITYNGTSSLKMTFESRRTRDIPYYLWASFAWFRRGNNASFIPANHCNIKPIESSQTYQLACQVGERKYTETVSPEIPMKDKKLGH